jgi:hypothetical protein
MAEQPSAPCYHLVYQVTQCYIITIVAELNVEWATDCEQDHVNEAQKRNEPPSDLRHGGRFQFFRLKQDGINALFAGRRVGLARNTFERNCDTCKLVWNTKDVK